MYTVKYLDVKENERERERERGGGGGQTHKQADRETERQEGGEEKRQPGKQRGNRQCLNMHVCTRVRHIENLSKSPTEAK